MHEFPPKSLFVDIDQLIEEIVESSNDAQRIAACNRFLIRSIELDRENFCVRRALESIMLTRGRIPVESLATLIGTEPTKPGVGISKRGWHLSQDVLPHYPFSTHI